MEPQANSPPPPKAKIDPKELALKYKQLAEEYNKIKRENQILKKAVLQEHEKAAVVGQTMREAEIKVQTMMEENEALTFNNDRLTKRVAILQKEVNEKAQAAGWFNWGDGEELQKSKTQVEVLMEELSRKASENASLHKDLHVVKQEQQQVVQLLESKMQRVKTDLEITKEDFFQKEQEYSNKLTLVEAEKDEISSTAERLSTEIEQLDVALKLKTKEQTQISQTLSRDTAKYTNLINRQILFDDNQICSYNNINLPAFTENAQAFFLDFMMTVSHLFEDLVSGIIQENALLSERIIWMGKATSLSPQLIQVFGKVQEMTPSFQTSLQPLLKEFQQLNFSEEPNQQSKQLQSTIVNNFSTFLVFHKKFISWVQMALKEESKQRDCVKSIQQINDSLHDFYMEFQENCEKLIPILQTLATTDNNAFPTEYSLNIHALEKSLAATLHNHVQIFKLIASKIEKEDEDPFLLPKLRSVNQTYLNAAKTVNNIFERIQVALQKYISAIDNPQPVVVRGVSQVPSVNTSIQNRAVRCLDRLNQIPSHVSIPYHKQIDNHDELQQLREELESKSQTIIFLNRDIQTAIEDKDRASKEYTVCKDSIASKTTQLNDVLIQLAETRKQLERVRQLYAQKSADPSSVAAPPEVQEDDLKGNKWSLTVLDENGSESNKLNQLAEDRERETKLKQFYADKFKVLDNQLRTADAKVTESFVRQEQLEKQLAAYRAEKEDLTSKLSNEKKQLSKIQETADVTKTNYEMQLNMLSEHVVAMSQKISTTECELDKIKEFKVRCAKCKTWNTIAWLIKEGKNGQLCSRGPHASSLNFA